MNKQLSFAQITNKTLSIQFNNIDNTTLNTIEPIIKKYQGSWNPLIQLYQINIQHTTQFIKAVRQIDEKIKVKDVPSKYLKSLLNQRGQENNHKIHLLPKNKWKRIFAFDPYMMKRFDFAEEFGSKKQQKNYKRVLLIVWQLMKNKWESQFESRKVYFENADHYELITPNELYKIESNVTLKHGQFNILTYERLSEMHQNLTKSSLQKYNTIMLDDSEMWIQSENSPYKRGQLGEIMRNLLKNKYSASKELVIFTSRFIIEKPQLGLQVANILLPNNFGFEAVAIAKGEANDATWMKKRYVNQSKYFRQLLFIFNSMFLIDLLQPGSKISDQRTGVQNVLEIDNFYGITLADEQVKKLNYVGNKIKNVNKKQALACFQGSRSTNPRSPQARYIEDLGKAITNSKLPYIFNYLNHIIKKIKIRTIVVVQNQLGQQKIEKFMKQQSISYVLYQINSKQVQSGEMCLLKKDNYSNPSVYLIVRQTLLSQYNSSCLQTQKNLKKINNAHHVLLIDTFWQQFQLEKENLFKNIVEYTPVEYVTDKKIGMVRHFFTVRHAVYNQMNMVYRYLENLSSKSSINYQIFNQKPTLDQANKTETNKTNQFGREVIQKRTKAIICNVSQQPIYHNINTIIDDIIINSPQSDKLNIKSKYGQEKMQLEVKTNKKSILEALAQYDCLSESTQGENQAVLAKQVEMNIVRKAKFIELQDEQQEIIYLERKQSNLKISKPFKLSTTQVQVMRKVQQNLQRETKRRENLRRQLLSKNINKEGLQYRLGQKACKNRALWRGHVKAQRQIEKKIKRLQIVMVSGRSSMKKIINFQDDGDQNMMI